MRKVGSQFESKGGKIGSAVSHDLKGRRNGFGLEVLSISKTLDLSFNFCNCYLCKVLVSIVFTSKNQSLSKVIDKQHH